MYRRRGMAARMLLSADLADVEVALAKAFLDDPMVSWVIGDEDADRRMVKSAAGFFRPALAAGLRRGHSYVAGDGTSCAASVWAPPDVAMLDEDEGAAFGMALHEVAGDEAVGRVMALAEMVGVHHPEDRPHFYLFVLGAAVQGHGAGGAVMQPVLERCDADGIGAYLESSNARNIGFYERHGFEVQWEEAPAPDGPVLRGMWREPGSARG